MESDKKIKKGKVIIFNMGENREGSQRDVERLKDTFEKLNADVEICLDNTTKGISDRMVQVRTEDFSAYDYLAIAWGSHGHEDGTIAVSRDTIFLQRALLLPMFKNKTLSKKLKWIIAQACRGELMPEGASIQEIALSDPRYYLISYATSEGSVSWRNTGEGSYFIRFLCDRLLSDYKRSDILTILQNVSCDVENCLEENNRRQVPCNEENFGETFKFSFVSSDTQE